MAFQRLALAATIFLIAACHPEARTDRRTPPLVPHGWQPVPDGSQPRTFEVALSPAAVNVPPGGSASTGLSIRWTEGEAVPLELRVEEMPPGFEASVDAERLTVHASALATLEGHAVAQVVASDGVRTEVIPFAIFSQPPSAEIDPSFGEGGELRILDKIFGAAEMEDGTIMLAGSVAELGWRPALCRITPDGQRVETFGDDGCVLLAPSHHGTRHFARSPGGFAIASLDVVRRVHDDGSADTSFSMDGFLDIDPTPHWDEIEGIAVDPTGGLVVVGSASEETGETTGFVVRLRQDGSEHWTVRLESPAMGAVVVDEGRILVQSHGVRAFLPDGTPDLSFGENGVVAAGGAHFTIHDGDVFVSQGGVALVRLSMDGEVLSVRDDFPEETPDMTPQTFGMASDGSFIFGGAVDDSDLAIGRRTADGFVDVGFAPGGTATFRPSDYNADATGALPLRDGRILLYGTVDSDFGTPPAVVLCIRG